MWDILILCAAEKENTSEEVLLEDDIPKLGVKAAM
jgi:hypothetical protein